MSGARARLAALAALAGYPPEALTLIAHAALPAYHAGAQLDESALAQVGTAVEVLAQCGHRADVLGVIVAHYRDRYGETCWREQFWQRQLRTAALRFNHPRFYGLSPCEADPARLAAAAPLRRAA